MITLCHSFRLMFQSQAGIEAERLRVNASVCSLQQQLEDCRDESSHWMEQFHSTRDELRSTKQEWVPVGSRGSQSVFFITCLGHSHRQRLHMVALWTCCATNACSSLLFLSTGSCPPPPPLVREPPSSPETP